MCFRPVKAEKKIEPILVIESISAVADSSKQFKLEAKNTGVANGNLLDKVLLRESSAFSDTEVAVVWNPVVIAPNEKSTGVITFDWLSGKTYYITAQTKEGPSAKLYTKTP